MTTTKLNYNWSVDTEELLTACQHNTSDEVEIVGYVELIERCFLAVNVTEVNSDGEYEDTRYLLVRDGLEGVDLWNEWSIEDKRDQMLDQIISDYSDTEDKSDEIQESAPAYSINSILVSR